MKFNSVKTLLSISLRRFKFGNNFSTAAQINMRLVQFQPHSGGPQQLGAQIANNGDVFDLSAIDSCIPNTTLQFLQAGPEIWQRAQRIVAEGKSMIPLSNIQLLAPITRPDKVVCVALNYSDHCLEQNKPFPKEPMFFSKFSSTIIGPCEPIKLPSVSQKVDWEVELAVVMGKEARCLKPEQVDDHIFGFTIAQDISARDWQKERNGGQFLLGKSMDTFCPLGPVIVSKNKLDYNNLNLKTMINGVIKQNGNTKDLIFKIDYIISFLSELMTLYPGDVILTGTPAGVGVHSKPPQFLQKGDIVHSAIEGIGSMENPVE